MIEKKAVRLIPLILAVASTLTLSACSGPDSGSGTPPAEQTQAPQDPIPPAASEASHPVEAAIETATSAVSDAQSTANAAVESASNAVTETAAKTNDAAKELTDKATATAKETKSAATAAVATATKSVTEGVAAAKSAVSSKAADLTTAASTTSSHAEMLELAKESGCLACHSVDKKVIGPAWRDVAAKYRGQSDAKASVINSITKGSSGKWGGPMAMPANSPRVSDDNIARLAGFVLSLE